MKICTFKILFHISFFPIIIIFNPQLLSKPVNRRSINQEGSPFISQYFSDDYKAFSQNWAVVQDSFGIMYFGNGDGVLTYDGTNWNLITLPNQGTVFALAKDKKGKIYVGAMGEMGYLKPDSIGRLNYISLLPLLKKDDRNFSLIRKVYTSAKGIYFQSPEVLFYWTGKKFKVWKPDKNKFSRSFFVNNKLLIQQKNRGLLQLENDEFKTLPNSEFISNKIVYSILPYDNQKLLIGTRNNGLFLYDGKSVHQFQTEINEYLKNKKLYCGIVINDSTFAFGSLQGGLVIINKSGEKLLALYGEDKLLSSSIFNLYKNKSGIIWAAMNNGVAKIEYPSPFSKYDSYNGLKGEVQAIAEYHKKIYAGTNKGLYYLDNNNLNNSAFHLIKGTQQKIWCLLPYNNFLLIALDDGLYQLKKHRLKLIKSSHIYTLQKSKLDANRIFVGLTEGLISLYYKNGNWKDEGKIPGIYGGVYNVIETDNGNLWLATNVNWIWKVNFESRNKALNLENPRVEKYGMNKGLPDDVGSLYLLENNLLYVSILNSNKVFQYNETSDTFQPDQTLNKFFRIDPHSGARYASGVNEQNIKVDWIDEKGNIWFDITKSGKAQSSMVAWKLSEGKYNIENLHEERILNLIGESIYYDQAEQSIWYNAKVGLIKHDLSIKNEPDTNYYSLISKVIFDSDSILYAGAGNRNNLVKHTLPFKGNNFRFQYSALSFHNEKANQYQYYLEGFNEKWSAWSNETQRDFTNLSEGNYIFHVRAKNIYGKLSKEDRYAFIILPPWYQTWWAYILYIFTLLGLVGLVVQWRSKHLRHEKETLESIVQERTKQLTGQAHQLSEQAKQLSEQAKQLKELDQQKSRFFANISHEFRTPLTLIKGPVDNILQSPFKSLSKEDEIMIRNNADRLLKLVNQLLELSKVDANSLKLSPVPGDIFEFLCIAGSAFSSHAEQRNINYRILIPENKLYTTFDHDKMEKVIYNLLSNAFKFTPDKGEITLSASYKNDILAIEVIDSGIGVSPEQIPFIFDRFYQIDDSLTREHEGTGIGLSLTKELIALMNGNINVQSKPGEGSRFIIKLPIALLNSEQSQEGGEKLKSQTLDTIFMRTDFSSSNDKDLKASSLREESATNSYREVGLAAMGDRLLIVEDNADMRSFIKQHLHNNYKILQASNGKEGLKIAKNEIPDLIITDLMMPQMDGISLCEKLKKDEHTNHIPIIMLTAKAGQEHKIEGLKTGADSYLTKPFDRKELEVLVINLLTQRKNLREKYSREFLLEPEHIPVSSLDEQFLKKIIDCLEINFSKPEFGVSNMQEAAAMGKTQFHAKMKALTNQTPGEFLRNYRLKRAAQILSKNGGNVTQVAYSVGFNNLSYFAKCFKELFGTTPSEYHQNVKTQKN